jgi:hypothetical protein
MGRTVGNPQALALDIVSLAIGTFGMSFTAFNIQLPPHLAKAGQWQFLTNLSLAYSLIVFFIGAVAHITKSQLVFKLKNDIHPIALALECVVTIVYWPLRIFWIHLLTKDPASWGLPLQVDLLIHLMPAISLLLDYFLFMPRWTLKKTSAFGICSLLTSFYWFWLHHIIDFENGGDYPYLFLAVERTSDRVAIFSLVGFTGFALYLLLNSVYLLVVRKAREE